MRTCRSRLFDNPRRAARAVHVPGNKAAEVTARADIGETTAARDAGIGAEDDLLPGFYRLVVLSGQSIDGAPQRVDLFVERVDLRQHTLGIAEPGRLLRARFEAECRNRKRIAGGGCDHCEHKVFSRGIERGHGLFPVVARAAWKSARGVQKKYSQNDGVIPAGPAIVH